VKHTLLLVAFSVAGLELSFGSATLLTDDEPSTGPPRSVFAEGEDLVYEVSWTFFKLGTIHINALGDFKAIAHIDSYEGLPIVDLHSVHYTEMDSDFYSKGGYAIDKDGKEWKGLNYISDPSGKKVIVEQLYHRDPTSPPYKREQRDTIQMLSSSFVDGLSIAFFPRPLLHTLRTVNVSTMLKGNVGTTTFYYTNERTDESISALDEPVRVLEVDGSTNAVGVIGMSGDFTGWFSDDAEAVPIKGKLKVLLGSLTLELVQWNRKGWKPPQ